MRVRVAARADRPTVDRPDHPAVLFSREPAARRPPLPEAVATWPARAPFPIGSSPARATARPAPLATKATGAAARSCGARSPCPPMRDRRMVPCAVREPPSTGITQPTRRDARRLRSSVRSVRPGFTTTAAAVANRMRAAPTASTACPGARGHLRRIHCAALTTSVRSRSVWGEMTRLFDRPRATA